MRIFPRLLGATLQSREALARYIPFVLGAPLEIDAVTSAVKCFPDLPAPQPVDWPPQAHPTATQRGPRPKGKACRPYLGAAEIRPKGYDASRQYVPRLPACSYENIRLICERLGIHYTSTYQAYYRQVVTFACRKYQVGWVDWATMESWLLQAFPEPVSPQTQLVRRRVLLRAGLLELRRRGGTKRGSITHARLPGVAQINRPPAGWDAARDEVRRKDAERQRRYYAAKKAKQSAASVHEKLRDAKRRAPHKMADTGREVQNTNLSRPHQTAKSTSPKQEAAPCEDNVDGGDDGGREGGGGAGGGGAPPAPSPASLAGPPAPTPSEAPPQQTPGEATAALLRARLRARELGAAFHGAIIAQLGDAIWQLVLGLAGGPCLEMLATYIPEALDIALADLARDIDRAGLRLPGSPAPPRAVAGNPWPPGFKGRQPFRPPERPPDKPRQARYQGAQRAAWRVAYRVFGAGAVDDHAAAVNAIARWRIGEEHLAELARKARASARSPAGAIPLWYAKAQPQRRDSRESAALRLD